MLGEILRTKMFLWRGSMDWTQRQAAELVKLPYLTYRMLERGRLRASEREMEALRSYFGERAEDMLEPLA